MGNGEFVHKKTLGFVCVCVPSPSAISIGFLKLFLPPPPAVTVTKCWGIGGSQQHCSTDLEISKGNYGCLTAPPIMAAKFQQQLSCSWRNKVHGNIKGTWGLLQARQHFTVNWLFVIHAGVIQGSTNRRLKSFSLGNGCSFVRNGKRSDAHWSKFCFNLGVHFFP